MPNKYQQSQEVSLTGKAYKTDQAIAEAILKLDELAKIMRS